MSFFYFFPNIHCTFSFSQNTRSYFMMSFLGKCRLKRQESLSARRIFNQFKIRFMSKCISILCFLPLVDVDSVICSMSNVFKIRASFVKELLNKLFIFGISFVILTFFNSNNPRLVFTLCAKGFLIQFFKFALQVAHPMLSICVCMFLHLFQFFFSSCLFIKYVPFNSRKSFSHFLL